MPRMIDRPWEVPASWAPSFMACAPVGLAIHGMDGHVSCRAGFDHEQTDSLEQATDVLVHLQLLMV